MKDWFKKLLEAISKPEAERAAAIAALGEPPETTAAAATAAPAAGATSKSTNEELLEIIKAQNAQLANVAKELADMKQSQTEQQDALKATAKKALDEKINKTIAEAQKTGRIALKDDKSKKFWEARLTEDFDTASEMIQSLPAKVTQKTDAASSQTTDVQTTTTQRPLTIDDYRKAAQAAFTQN